MSQHKNYDISKMREYFCTKFCSFVYKTTAHKFASLCCIYLRYAKLTNIEFDGDVGLQLTSPNMNYKCSKIMQAYGVIIVY